MKLTRVAHHFKRFAAAAGLAAICMAAHAEDFSLAISSPPTSMDPHFHANTPNYVVSAHMFEALVKMNEDSTPVPGLAESWKPINDVTWEFKLRKGVKFHDGSELTAQDVAWSLDRPATMVNSPGKYDIFTRSIASKKIVDPYTIRLTTHEPYPLLPRDLAAVVIVSKKATEGLKSEDFANGKGMIGTGPFKFVRYLRNDRVEMERNDHYWGPKPAWDKVSLRFISNNATRLAALLAGDVQAIEAVPTADLPKVRENSNLQLYSKVSHRLIYVFMDSARDKSPYVTDANGKILEHNPLKDRRVRAALSMGINREAIRDRVMQGMAVPASNLVPIRFFGYNPAIKETRYDPQGAKKLLAEAGYPNGFDLTLHTPNNRYVNDEKIAQTIAQMWAKIGVNTRVESQPVAVFVAQSSPKKNSYSAGLFGWGAATGESSSSLRAIAACYNSEKGMGSSNRGPYCNPKVDAVLEKALYTMDDGERLKLLQEATAVLTDDVGVIPIHHQVTTWATRKGIGFTPRTDETSFAQDFHPLH
ncbi:ABC transporter substrate-binding protein [Herbaspirillum sp. ST 5-3]|uniref:ABC transporter substrate-binding protein n=1 Tax=Oxalobacteraceae TaxID=75682 RepID=UPI0010A3F699